MELIFSIQTTSLPASPPDLQLYSCKGRDSQDRASLGHSQNLGPLDCLPLRGLGFRLPTAKCETMSSRIRVRAGVLTAS